MSAHVLLNLLNKLRKSDKMISLSSIYRFFSTSLIKLILYDTIHTEFSMSAMNI